jgi:hypothetical protein
MGLLRVSKPELLRQEMDSLRKELLNDPYFKNVPSMQVNQRKTALAFHAKDDVAEVRREVFRLLLKHDVEFFAIVRDKTRIANLVREHNSKGYRYHPNHLYDRCTGMLMAGRLHREDSYRLVFSRRGHKDRTAALKKSLGETAPTEVMASSPSQETCLQAVDYFIWTLQRLYERDEDRYLQLVWEKVGEIKDVDDLSAGDGGKVYGAECPLRLEDLRKRPGV